MVIHFFSEEIVPKSWKSAQITPLLKKLCLYHNVASSYRPISNLPVLSKLSEKLVHNRAMSYLNNLWNLARSVSSALLRVLSLIWFVLVVCKFKKRWWLLGSGLSSRWITTFLVFWSKCRSASCGREYPRLASVLLLHHLCCCCYVIVIFVFVASSLLHQMWHLAPAKQATTTAEVVRSLTTTTV